MVSAFVCWTKGVQQHKHGHFISVVPKELVEAVTLEVFKKKKVIVMSFLFSPLQIVHIDLSNSVIPTSALESIISRCRLFECLSLEGLQLSDNIIK